MTSILFIKYNNGKQGIIISEIRKVSFVEGTLMIFYKGSKEKVCDSFTGKTERDYYDVLEAIQDGRSNIYMGYR